MKFLYVFLVLSIASSAYADRIRLLPNDHDALQARVDIIQQAKHEILAEYFSVWNDSQSIGGFALLLDAAKRGIKVKIIMDAMYNTVPKAFFTTLMQEGRDAQGNLNIEVKLYNPPTLNLLKISHRDHAKMIIVDGERMIIGGRNIGDKYFGINKKRNFIDLDVILDGHAVQDARTNFFATFNSKVAKDSAKAKNMPSAVEMESCQKINSTVDEIRNCERRKKIILGAYKESLQTIEKHLDDIMTDTPTSLVKPNTGTDWLADVDEGSDLEFIAHQPDKLVSQNTADLTAALKALVSSAKNDVNILSPYLVPTKGMVALFESLIQRGVKVRIITNSFLSTDNSMAQAGYLESKDRLIKMGIELYEYNGPDTSHAKTVIIDGSVAFVGTYNLDPRSAFLNREAGILVKSSPDNKVAEDLSVVIDKFRANALLVGKDGQYQNQEQQDARYKSLSTKKRAVLRIIRLLVPLFKSQI